MTVAELIKALQDLAIAHDASELPVRFDDGEYGPTDIAEVKLELDTEALPPNATPQRCVHVVLFA